MILDIMNHLGVKAEMAGDLLRLTKSNAEKTIHFDFTDCPDLAQTVSVVCAAKGITGYFTGLESLRIKETDRIAALQQELAKIGAALIEDDAQHWRMIPSNDLPSSGSFATYKDHRMAMAFAPLAMIMDVDIEKPEVVKKSYPNFWNDIRSLGIAIKD